MVFWGIAAILSVLTVAVVTRPLLRGRDSPADSANVTVFKDQLAEIDGDLTRGVLSESEAESLRIEVSRRLLAAAETEDRARGPAPAGISRMGIALIALVVLGGGGLTYALIGSAGAPDQPLALRLEQNAARYAARPSQAEMLAQLEQLGNLRPAPELPEEQAALFDQLRGILAQRPNDLQGHQLLADNLASARDWIGAAAAQREVLRIKGNTATAADHADRAEYLILATNGYVSPEAETALRAALEADPQEPRARYYSGLSALQAGRPDLAYDLWVRLLSDSRPDAPWVRAINSQIRDVATAAGRGIPRGPSAADIEAAGGMEQEDRQAMIEGMVAQLADRLATEGGPAEDWARLIRAYGVLGERARADRIWTEAQEVFASSPGDLALLRQAARDAEISQ